MTYNQLKSMSMASLLDASHDTRRNPQEQLQAAEAVLAFLPGWDGQVLDLDPGQRGQLEWLVDWANMTEPLELAA